MTLVDNWERETLITPKQAAARLGKTVAMVYLYFTVGIVAPDGEKVRLESIKLGGGLRTSREALRRWIVRISLPATIDSPPTKREIAKRDKENRRIIEAIFKRNRRY